MEATAIKAVSCMCGCDRFSKKEMEDLLSGNIDRFLADKCIVKVFRQFIEHNSVTHKHLDTVDLASQLYEETIISDIHDILEKKLENLITMDLYTELCENDADKRATFKKIRDKYSKKIEESDDYKRFREDLKRKYSTNGKVKKTCTIF